MEFQKVLPNRSNLLARLTPVGRVRQRILLAPHLDTVGTDDAGLVPIKRGDRLFGRGACDTKGSVASMLMAVCDLARSKQRPRETEIIFPGWWMKRMRRQGHGPWRRADLRPAWRSWVSQRDCRWSQHTRAAFGCGSQPMEKQRTEHGRNSGATLSTPWRASWMPWKRVTPLN